MPPPSGERIKTLPDVSAETITGDSVDRARFMVAARQWTLARMAPKRYGNRIAQEIMGADCGPLDLAGPPRRTVEAMKEFARELWSGFQEHVHEASGDHARLDAKAIDMLSGIVVDYAATGRSDGLPPREMAGALAGIEFIRRKIVIPEGMKLLGR